MRSDKERERQEKEKQEGYSGEELKQFLTEERMRLDKEREKQDKEKQQLQERQEKGKQMEQERLRTFELEKIRLENETKVKAEIERTKIEAAKIEADAKAEAAKETGTVLSFYVLYYCIIIQCSSYLATWLPFLINRLDWSLVVAAHDVVQECISCGWELVCCKSLD